MRILLTIVSWLASSAFRIDSISFYLGQVRKASTKSIIIQPMIRSDCWNRIFPSTSTASSVQNIMVRIHQLYIIYIASICLKLFQPGGGGGGAGAGGGGPGGRGGAGGEAI